MNRLNSEYICGYFCAEENLHNLRAGVQPKIPQVKNMENGIPSLKFRGPLLWISRQSQLKESNPASAFKC